jgi:hypothetical protein
MIDMQNMDLAGIHALWQKYIKKPVPQLNKNTLIKYICWYQQIKENKVPLRPFLKLLEKAEREYAENKLEETAYENGTKFIRSYKGNKYEVEVIKDGFLFKGEIYKSLSSIARKITGKQWNGKIFFRGNNGRK